MRNKANDVSLENTIERLKNHKLEIQVVSGINKVIRFAKHDTIDEQIYIATFKNRLVYSGDLGTFVFRHACCEDMLKFFANDINLCYWRESLIAGKALQFDDGTAEENLTEIISDWYEDLDDEQKEVFDKDDLDEMIADATSEICNIDNENSFFDYINGYSYDITALDMNFDFNSTYNDAYICHEIHTWHYEFACHAIHVIAKELINRLY